jgi:Tol biopolymer transport system component
MVDRERDIWVWDFARSTLTRVTHGPYEEWYPVWTPDGRELVFGSGPPGNLDSDQSGRFEVYVRPFPNVSGGQMGLESLHHVERYVGHYIVWSGWHKDGTLNLAPICHVHEDHHS